MEEKRKFKVLLVGTNTNKSSITGEAQNNGDSTSPVRKSLVDIGLTEANAKGEANIRKTIKNPKGSGKKPKDRDKNFYPLHRFIEIYNKVFVVLKPNSKVNFSNFTDFIHATDCQELAVDIVDILPPLFDAHFTIIASTKSRFMVGDKVTVNFKYRSTIELEALKQKEPRTIVDIKFVNLVNMTVIVAYLDDKDFYPINELDHYDTD